MKKIILSILSAVVALTATAQNFNVNAVVICKTDGTRDTITVAKQSSALNSSFYGKENPVDDDYIQLSFTLSDNYDITCSCSLTPVGKNAPYDSYGIMLSSNHIDSIPKYSYNGYYGQGLYIVDTKQWYRYSYEQYIGGKYEYVYYASDIEQSFRFVPGQNYYARAYYLLDGKAYYSSEIELRAVKTLNAVRNYYYSDYANMGNSLVVKIDAEKIFGAHADLFGAVTDYKKLLLAQYISRALTTKDQSELLALTTKTEECDDGTLYILDDVPASVLDEALQLIDNDLKKTRYLQANKENLYTGGTSSDAFRTTTDCTFEMVTADEKWGIRDNQYLLVTPIGTYRKPMVAFELTHLVQPGKTYDVTLTFAPNTEDETDSLRTCFDVLIADLADNGTVPLTTKAERFGTDTLVSKKPAFIAMPHELKVMTMQYTAKSFVDKLYLLIENPLSVFNAKIRASFSFGYRIVGVEVKPHEE